MNDANRVITADLCDNYHRFFYFQDDRQPCPYCKIERLTAEVSCLKEFISDYPLTNNRPTDLEIERCAWIERGQALVQTTEKNDD